MGKGGGYRSGCDWEYLAQRWHETDSRQGTGRNSVPLRQILTRLSSPTLLTLEWEGPRKGGLNVVCLPQLPGHPPMRLKILQENPHHTQ